MPLVAAGRLQAQDTLHPVVKAVADTLAQATPVPVKDTLKARAISRDTFYVANSKLPHSPRKAALYSAVIPGLGQAYNREYWKIPLIYAAIGTCTYFFIDNMKTYKEFRDAYRLKKAGIPDPNGKYNIYDPESLKYNRDTFREYMDYSVLFFILAYGLNIADATVFAHLRTFDMSNDLSIRVSPTLINNRTLGVGVNITLGGKKNNSYRYVAGR
nr:DUF5683 domain-containing protein [Chitinophaga nivalis]